MTLEIREIPAGEMAIIYTFIQQLNKDMTEERFTALLAQMLERGYRCAGAFDGEGKLLGVAGFWELVRFWCGTHIDIDNVVTDESLRGQGIGKKLIHWIEDWARARGLSFAVLDSYAHNSDSHRFYFREGYIIRGFHFTKDL
ncbi:MAG: GNAT family N-acetyltransferase [Alphaproteobacteria bacterium]|nr:GNAT family N-acetyltransferase [Alphaproteobacteria bacterium]